MYIHALERKEDKTIDGFCWSIQLFFIFFLSTTF